MSRISGEARALDGLNAQQRAAVEHGAGPLLVIAGAGSGKTRTLAARVRYLIDHGADPQRILMLTFSRRAADEMARRVASLAGAVDEKAPGKALDWSGTFHAIGARLLREYAPLVGLREEFTIHDRSDSGDLMGLARAEMGFAQTINRFPMKATCLSIYSRALNARAELEDVLAEAFPWCRAWRAELEALFARYVSMKQEQNVLDYDDLLFYWAGLMEEQALAEDVSAKFDYVLVDEYQDTNRLQAKILYALRPDGAGLTVVGDDAQAIYGFRAAAVENILEFPSVFGGGARTITLEQNYRSSAPILAASNAVIDLAERRFTKNLFTSRAGGAAPRLVTVRDESDQARYVADCVLEARERGVELKQQAVLFRASDHAAQVELEFARRDIPFVKFGGLKFLEAAHVKDVLALMRWLQNPTDRVSGFRCLQLIAGVGPVKAAKVLDGAARDGAAAAFAATPAPSGGEEAWDALHAMVGRAGAGEAWPRALEIALKWYAPVLEARYGDARARLADLDQLLAMAATSASREAFLADLTLDPPMSSSDEAGVPHRDDDYAILSTIHSAKGQEWKNVHVVNAVDGCIPSDLATGERTDLEEERRLLYVAMTRARDELHIITPQRFYVQQQRRFGDKHMYALRTRFITPEMTGLYEQMSWSPAASGGDGAVKAPLPSVDLAAKARGVWKAK